MTVRHSLDRGWQLQLVDGPSEAGEAIGERPIAATVPGSVHTDLLAAGVIPDPYQGLNEAKLGWIGRSRWQYATSVEWTETDTDRVDLVFEGLDTITTIDLNGSVIGRTSNMHRRYRFDVRDVLTSGANPLSITFEAPVDAAEQARDEHGDLPRPAAYRIPYNFIRKMACNFGWDWGPVLPTAGIWRSVYLEAWSVGRLDSVRPHVTIEQGQGRVAVDVTVERSSPAPVWAVVALGDATREAPLEGDEVRLELEVDDPALWWPQPHGDQPLYELAVELRDDAGTVLDRWSRRVAFRHVEIDTTEDEAGGRWMIRINGKPIWVRGANWIPDDCFPSRVGRERYRRRIDQAVAAGVDLLRVWGGGIYESEDFYTCCDEQGLMVWQDFLFACAAYPETDSFRAEVEAEARDNIARLMPHPSLVVWSGNNESLWGHEDWGWGEELAGRPWGEGYYRDLLPGLVEELDGTRPYLPGSPYSPDGDHPNDPRHGVVHLWDVWNVVDYVEYRHHRPRFVAEFGYQGPPTWTTLVGAVGGEPTTGSPALLSHQKADDGMEKLERGLRSHFVVPAAFDDWHFLSQINQARAISVGIEHFRSLKPHCWGSIVWQLNDCWPVTSWAVIDGEGRLKPMWYALRRSYADRLVTVQPSAWDLEVVMVQERDEPWQVTGWARRLSLEGTVLAEEPVTGEVEPRGVRRHSLSPAVSRPSEPAAELLVVDADDGRAVWRWVPDNQLAYPPAQLTAEAQQSGEGVLVVVRAETLVVDLVLLADRVEPSAVVDDMLVTLLPGEEHRFRVASDRPFDPAELTRRPALRCVNDVAGLTSSL